MEPDWAPRSSCGGQPTESLWPPPPLRQAPTRSWNQLGLVRLIQQWGHLQDVLLDARTLLGWVHGYLPCSLSLILLDPGLNVNEVPFQSPVLQIIVFLATRQASPTCVALTGLKLVPVPSGKAAWIHAWAMMKSGREAICWMFVPGLPTWAQKAVQTAPGTPTSGNKPCNRPRSTDHPPEAAMPCASNSNLVPERTGWGVTWEPPSGTHTVPTLLPYCMVSFVYQFDSQTSKTI